MAKSSVAARHTLDSRRPKPVIRVIRTFAIGLVVLIASGASLSVIIAWSVTQRVADNAVDISGGGEIPPPPAVGEFEGPFNILIVGADNDAAQGDRYGERDGTRNDVNLLLHVSADHTNGVALSLPRDLVIRHPECTAPDGTTFAAMSAQPINVALERGGLACVVTTVESLTGLEIGHAGLVSFDGVIQMTEAIGGVPVCLDAPLRDERVVSPTTGEILDLPAGEQRLQGDEALGFLRSRYAVGDGGDLGRISSQQQFLASLVRTVKSDETLRDIPRLLSLASIATDSESVQLSTSLGSANTILSMALTLRTLDLDSLVFAQYPVTTDPRDPNRLVPLEAKADEVLALIRADQPFALGADSQGPGVVGSAPDTAIPPAEPSPSGPVGTASPSAPPPPVIDGVKGQTAEDETCTAVNG